MTHVARLFDCIEVEGDFEGLELGVMSEMFNAKTLKTLQTTQLLAPARPWSRAMQTALSHLVAFKADEARQAVMPVTSMATASVMNT
jgi:hypothetical protein